MHATTASKNRAALALLNLAERYETTDVGIVTIAYRLEDRVRSYELIAREFGLPGLVPA